MIDRIIKHDLFVPVLLACGLFLYQILTAFYSSYGFFIDEFYYIACSKHLAFGYIDHPPLSIVLLAVSRWLLGDSLVAIRIFPALAASATVLLTGILARELGGSRLAMMLASLAALAQPVLLIMGSFYSMNAFEPLIWAATMFCIVRMVKKNDARYWLAIGVLLGVGLEVKHTMIIYTIALGAGLLMTSLRRMFMNKWFWWGMAVCFILVLPNILWQILNGIPSLEFYRNAMVNKNIPRGFFGIVADQILFANPFSVFLWITGLWYFFFHKDGSTYRFFGWSYLLLFIVMVVSQSSRPDRIAAIYPVLFAGGAVVLDTITKRGIRQITFGISAAILSFGFVLFAPVTTPLLSPPALRQYLSAIGFSFSVEQGKMNDPIPQWLADRLGWEELAANVCNVFYSLPERERVNTIIIARNYGDAGACEMYGKKLGLPPVYCIHNSYHTWGPPPDSVKTYIFVHFRRRDLENRFESIEEAAIQPCADCSGPQQRVPIYVARNPNFSIEKEWPGFKIYN